MATAPARFHQSMESARRCERRQAGKKGQASYIKSPGRGVRAPQLGNPPLAHTHTKTLSTKGKTERVKRRKRRNREERERERGYIWLDMAHTYEGGIPARVYLGTLLVALCFHPISVGGGKVTVWQTALHSDQLFSLSIWVTLSSLTTVHQQHPFDFLFYLHFLSYRRVGKRYNSVLEEYHVQTIYWATQSMLNILGWFGLEALSPTLSGLRKRWWDTLHVGCSL